MQKKVTRKRKLTRPQVRDLDIEIGFLEGIVQRDPDFLEALRILGDDYLKRGRFEDGLRIDEYFAQRNPDDPLVLYNLGCSYSLAKQLDHAVMALCRAIDRGYDNFDSILRDPDLANLRKAPVFGKLRAKIGWIQIKTA